MEHTATMLIVEDNAAQLETLTTILEQAGFQPVACANGRAAIAACQQQVFPVAILDLRLPDMDGLDVLSRLKQLAPEMKVIVNTAYATLDSAMTAVNREAFAYVQKLGDAAELIEHVHRAFHAHLVGYSARLEQDVNARTAELSQANAALRQEIEEHARAEERLDLALKDKDALMQEILHRTKNNMSAIMGLLEIQAARVGNAQVSRIFQEIQLRVQAMLFVQQKLYQSEDFTHLRFDDYLRELAYAVFRNLQTSERRIRLHFDLEPLSVSADTAIPCGLLINELITNALKYAFPDEQCGELTLSLRVDAAGQIELRVRDTGVGLPEGFDIQRTNSLGLKLVSNFVMQLRGTLDINRENGTEFVVRFHMQ